MILKRARQVHQKEERRQAIQAAALELLKGSSFQAITMAAVAQKSQLGKGTIFIYFNTKEELFLNLAEEGLLVFFEVLDEGLNDSRAPLNAKSLPPLVVEALESSPPLSKLLSILHTVLEHHVDRLKILSFREFLATRALRSARLLEQRLPFLGPGQGLELVFQILALASGAWQISDPAPAVKEWLESPGLQIFEISFRSLFERTLLALVLGLERPKDFQPQRNLFDEQSKVQGQDPNLE